MKQCLPRTLQSLPIKFYLAQGNRRGPPLAGGDGGGGVWSKENVPGPLSSASSIRKHSVQVEHHLTHLKVQISRNLELKCNYGYFCKWNLQNSNQNQSHFSAPEWWKGGVYSGTRCWQAPRTSLVHLLF